jgi:hypothetical protein
VSDIYLGGGFDVPLPQEDEQSGGYNWTVAGTYAYLQTTNRKLGEHPIPTGGHPYLILPNDLLAAELLKGVSVSGSDEDAAGAAIEAYAASAAGMDHAKSYLWPFTVLPTLTVTNGLIGG